MNTHVELVEIAAAINGLSTYIAFNTMIFSIYASLYFWKNRR